MEHERRHDNDKLDAIIAWQENFDGELKPKIIELVDILTKTRTIKEFLSLSFKLVMGAGILSGGLLSLNTLFHKL